MKTPSDGRGFFERDFVVVAQIGQRRDRHVAAARFDPGDVDVRVDVDVHLGKSVVPAQQFEAGDHFADHLVIVSFPFHIAKYSNLGIFFADGRVSAEILAIFVRQVGRAAVQFRFDG